MDVISDRNLFKLVISIFLICFLTACGGSLPRVTAEDRTFLDLQIEFLGEYQLPKSTFKHTPVGGLSALTYDRQTQRFYALSDDQSNFAPARFYTLNLILEQSDPQKPSISQVEIEDVTYLRNEQGETYPQGSLDTEGIAISPKRTLFISSEGNSSQEIAPFISEFDPKTGQIKQSLRLPERYLPNHAEKQDQPPQGIQDNRGFESLTLNPGGLAVDDPYRLFTATESALLQDTTPEESARIRLLHYVINPIGSPLLLAEHLYLLDPSTSETIVNGLTDLTALAQEGFFLGLERTLNSSGFGAKIYQVATGNATDTSRIASLRGNLSKIYPLKKELLLDLSEIGITLDNIEGMTLGPRLKDGSQSLILLSDDNFKDEQASQLLLFRLKRN